MATAQPHTRRRASRRRGSRVLHRRRRCVRSLSLFLCSLPPTHANTPLQQRKIHACALSLSHLRVCRQIADTRGSRGCNEPSLSLSLQERRPEHLSLSLSSLCHARACEWERERVRAPRVSPRSSVVVFVVVARACGGAVALFLYTIPLPPLPLRVCCGSLSLALLSRAARARWLRLFAARDIRLPAHLSISQYIYLHCAV